MKRPPKSRPPQDQTACVRLILRVLLNDFSPLQSLQDFIYLMTPKGSASISRLA
jgi:hypothetical protein